MNSITSVVTDGILLLYCNSLLNYLIGHFKSFLSFFMLDDGVLVLKPGTRGHMSPIICLGMVTGNVPQYVVMELIIYERFQYY